MVSSECDFSMCVYRCLNNATQYCSAHSTERRPSDAAKEIHDKFLECMTKKADIKLEGQDFDPDFNNPAFLRAVVKIQASFRGYQCRKALDEADIAMYCPPN
jgi:IQ calmodulin-binding motif